MLAAHYAPNSEALEFMSVFAQAARKPVLVLRHFGIDLPVPAALQAGVSALLDWDARALVDAFRRYARGEDTTGWDIVEFTLD